VAEDFERLQKPHNNNAPISPETETFDLPWRPPVQRSTARMAPTVRNPIRRKPSPTGELARRLGNPQRLTRVGLANAPNPIPL